MVFFFFKQKTAYEVRISDWSSDVCSSDLRLDRHPRVARSAHVHEEDRQAVDLLLDLVARRGAGEQQHQVAMLGAGGPDLLSVDDIIVAVTHRGRPQCERVGARRRFGAASSEEHTSALQSLMRTSYACFCLTQ